jgi:hypothetical protein
MKKSRESQIVAILKDGEAGVGIGESRTYRDRIANFPRDLWHCFGGIMASRIA